METIDTTAQKLYSPGQIALAAFLGAPVAACWFISRNYRQLDQPQAARQWFMWGVVGTVVLFIVAWFLPDRFPAQAVPIGYTFGFFHAAKQLWSDTIATHRAANGRLASWWAVAGISLLFLAAIFTLILGVIFALPEEYL